MNDVNNTLAQRGSKYGKFEDNAETTQFLVQILTGLSSFRAFASAVDLEAIHMVCHKLARMACGTGNVKDNWHDIVGYAKLAQQAGHVLDLGGPYTLDVSDDMCDDYTKFLVSNCMAKLTSVRALRPYEIDTAKCIIIALINLTKDSHKLGYLAWDAVIQCASAAEDLTYDE